MKKSVIVVVKIFKISVCFILFLFAQKTYAQIDSLHYIPPMCSFTSSSSNVDDHQMVLTTPETTPFDVTVTNNDGTFIRTVSGLSNTNPQKISLNFSAYTSTSDNTSAKGLGSQGVIGTNHLNAILDTEGLIVSGPKKFFVSIQQKSSAQGDLLTSKGTTGLGTDFYSGHMFSSKGGYDSHNGHFISVMASENNTNITFTNNKILFSGRTNNTFTVSLNKGQSVVIGVSVTQIKKQQGSTKNLNVVNGTHITSNKPIAVSSGSWCASGYPSSSPGRDVGFDQLVPTDVVGDEYIVIKGLGRSGGAQYNEKVLVVATEANTTVTYKSNIKTLVNAGDYFFTSINDFSNTTNGNIYIHADKKVFVYQTLSGANKKQTAGFCFIPPLKCTADKEVTLAFANKLSSLIVNPTLKLVTQDGSQIKLNGVNLASGFKSSVPGNTYWETYNIPKSELQKSKYGGGTNWIYRISSTGALNAMLAFESSNVGGGGFFSGFGDIPEVKQNSDIAEHGLCGDNVVLTASGFISYNWYRDGGIVSGENNATFQPTGPGRYKVTGLSPCGNSNTESFPSNEIRILPCLYIKSANITVTEGIDLNAVFRVELSHPWLPVDNVDVTFDYETAAGTADGGQDYTPATGPATIPSGQAFVDISVPIVNDALNENDEDFTFSISNVVEAKVSVSSGVCTIKDDNDAAPSISVSDQSFTEDVGNTNLRVSLSAASGKTITADYLIGDNTAVHPADFSASSYSGSLSFAPGETSKTIPISIVNDNIYEAGADEYFTIGLSNLSNTLVGSTHANLSISDNESLPRITVIDASAEEGTAIVFQANLDHPADVNISCNYQIALSNGAGKASKQDFIDYASFSLGTVNIPAGQTSVDFPNFTTKDDKANEQAETFSLNLSAANNATLATTQLTGTILDNEGSPTLSIGNASATEGNVLDFTISVSPIRSTDIVFQYKTINGTASSPADFTGSGWTSITLPANQTSMTLSIPGIQDTDEEGSENFTVQIGNPPSGVDIASGLDVGTGEILDDDDAPEAKNDSFSLNEDDDLTDNVMTNDLGLGDPPVKVITNTNPSNGMLTINVNGGFTYTPNANYNGADSFQYTIRDVDNDESSALVNITVNPMNDLPVAHNDTYSTIEDTQLDENVLTNDLNLFDLPISVSLVNDVSNGSLTLRNDGSFSFNPNSEFFGSDNFTYKVTDGNGDVVTASANIDVTFVNDAAPVAVDDSKSTNEDSPVVIDVLANDTDIDGNQTIDKATVFIQTSPANGTCTQNHTTGAVTYTPNSNYTGADSFTYTIKDDSGSESNTATVSVNVTVDNDPPVALCKDITVYLDGSGSYTLDPTEVDNGSNDDSDAGTVTLSVSPSFFDCSDKGYNTVTLTVTDADLAQSTCNSTVRVVDHSAPTVKTVQDNITIASDVGICGAKVSYTGPVFTDNCDGDQNGTLIAGLASGSTFPVGLTTVTFRFTDASVNTPVESSFTVRVTDSQDPLLANAANRTLSPNTTGCSYLVSGTAFDLTATDNCGIQSLVHSYDGGGSSLDGKSFPIGSTDVTWTAEDVNGNTASHIVKITVGTDLSVLLSGPAGNETCSRENVVFTASASGGSPAYQFNFFVNGSEISTGVSGNIFTTASLIGGDPVKVKLTDSHGCTVESAEIVITVYPKPAPRLYYD